MGVLPTPAEPCQYAADDAGGWPCGREAWFGIGPSRRHPLGLKVCGGCLARALAESGGARYWALAPVEGFVGPPERG